MRLNRCPARLVAWLPILFVCSVATAQPAGLRLGPQFGLRESPVGLKLRLVNTNSALFSLPVADYFLAPPAAQRNSNDAARSYTSLMADWSLNSDGLRATAGLVLRYGNMTRFAGDESRRDAAVQASPETYIGLGWSSEALGNRSWQFSADVGSFVSTNARCSRSRCATSPASGFRPETGGSGIRWTPYVAIGAQLSY